MCGIAGIVRSDGAPPDAQAVRAMNDALAHRGPDGRGTLEFDGAALGHRRLSVIDPSDAGAQPMSDASGRFHVTYNGEIYNYVELREELEERGVVFRSATDTEVLLAGWAAWGEGVLERLNGMFAFAIWDRRERVLFAARDRFGEKPFFYVHDDGEFRFASEVRALKAAGLDTRADRDVLFRFLAYGDTGTRAGTFFAGVRQVPPAHLLTLRAGRLDVRPYWSLPDRPEVPPGDERAHVEHAAHLLADSVRLRLRSDVPVGSCLSGGIDSSAIVALVARALQAGDVGPATARQLAFSAAFPGAPRDEIEHARTVAAAADVEPHEVAPDPGGFLDDLPQLVRDQGEPFSGPSIYAEWRVMRLAAEHRVTVLLNGQGADEVFAGYHFYFADHWAGLLRRGRFSRLRRSMRAYDDDHGNGTARTMLRDALRGRVPHRLRELRGGPRLPWLDAGFVASVDTEPAPFATGLRASLRDSRSRRMLPHLLRQADRSSMAFSREARLPFLDHRLVEFADALPPDSLLRGGTTKWILRQAVRGLVPDSVLERRDKVGFAVPTSEWMRGPLADPIRDTLTSPTLRDRGLFDPRGLARALAAFESGDDSQRAVVWNAWITEIWLRECVDG